MAACRALPDTWQCVKHLLQADADVTLANDDLDTALHLAAERADVKACRALIECNAGVLDAVNYRMNTPLST